MRFNVEQSKLTEAMVIDIIAFVLRETIGQGYRFFDYTINVSFIEIDALAYTCSEGNDIYIEIDVNSDIETVIQSLIHESIHLKQILLKQLNFLHTGFIFQGVYYHDDDNLDFDTPWEKEAYSMTEKLLKSYYKYAN